MNRGAAASGSRSYFEAKTILLLVDAPLALVQEDNLAQPQEESMKISYFPDVDSLYIDLSGKAGTDVSRRLCSFFYY
jgi:hypothetical protein